MILPGHGDAVHRRYAAPEEAGERMVRTWRCPADDFPKKSEQARRTRAAIDAFRQPFP
ncbi:hypothetical protein OG416_35970 (plasmid) [Streptomyces longwoodensis]|uniref:hypothetical protein n=1 Tax=Streptomyces longwoodensis TaxID=68231 RepID=UPI002F917D5B|nr:hypothetical protein OG416_35970 [Streptomyces longwoodensis]